MTVADVAAYVQHRQEMSDEQKQGQQMQQSLEELT